MSAPSDELSRWRDEADDGRPLRARAAALADAARDVPPLAPDAVARVRTGVLTGTHRRAGLAHTFGGMPVSLRLAAVACLVLLSAATAKGTAYVWRRLVAPAVHAPNEPAPAPTREGTSRLRGAHARVVAPAAAPAELPAAPAEPLAAPTEPPSAPVEAVAAPPSAERRAPASSPKPARTLALAELARARAPEAAAPASEAPEVAPPAQPAPALAVAPPPESEGQLLARALSQLRQAGDPRGALALLDHYADAFPRGVLAPEATRARLEALLQLDDRAAALTLLDGRAAFSGRLGAEAQLIRAELRASAGRHADARADFDALLGPAFASAHLPADMLERSLYGRAVCLGHLSQDAAARADLRLYQQRFPSGKHAAEAARLLGGGDPP